MIVGQTWLEAARRVEQLEESCPAWFVTPTMLVALSEHDAAVTIPGLAEERWNPTDLGTLSLLLRPSTLVRMTRFDAAPGEQDDSRRRPLLAPATIRAVEAGFRRALEGRDGLISIAEGAGEYAAVRSLVGRLLSANKQPLVLAATLDLERRLQQVLGEFEPAEADLGHERGRVILTRPAKLADLHEHGRNLPREDRVVVAFSVDAGFRGEQGFAARLLLPDAPWISLTNLPPDAVTPELLHAFADPHDDEGFLDVADISAGRVPVHEEYASLPIERAAQRILPHIPRAPGSTSLVLVSSSEEAEAMTAALAGHEISVHDATKWGQANEGWRLLQDPSKPVVVVRTSLPFWASVAHLAAAFVWRRVGQTTLARLRNMLSRPWKGKEGALMLLSADLVNPPQVRRG